MGSVGSGPLRAAANFTATPRPYPLQACFLPGPGVFCGAGRAQSSAERPFLVSRPSAPLHTATLPTGGRPTVVEIRNFEARGATVHFERWDAALLASFKACFPAAEWSQYYRTWGVPGKTGHKRALRWLAECEKGVFPMAPLVRRATATQANQQASSRGENFGAWWTPL
jgi:hypothetical protein